MIDLVSIYNIVLAKHYGIDWQDVDNLKESYDVYRKLPAKDRKQFDSLIKQAAVACKKLFKSFPKQHRTQQDMDIRSEIENEIYDKLKPMFRQYLS